MKQDPLSALHRPDYAGGSIVNLMASIVAARGGAERTYAPLALLEPGELSATRNLLLLIVDGLGHEWLTRRWPHSVIARHLRGRITSVMPTTTASAITTFLTARAPQQHGLSGWYIWFEEVNAVAAVLPFQTRIGQEPLTNRGADLVDLLEPRPMFQRIAGESHVVSPANIAHSPFNTAFSAGSTIHAFDDLPGMYARIVEIVGRDDTPRYLYAYWPVLDGHGHEYGMDSVESADHFNDIDAGFGRLLTALEGTDTTVVLTADHGFVDTSPKQTVNIEDHPALTAMLQVPLCGEGRAAYCYVNKADHPAFEQYVEAELGAQVTLARSADLLEAGFFGPGEPHPRLASRIGDYTLFMKDNWIVRDRVPGERHRHAPIGVHGGLSSAESYVPLVVLTPGA